jgi:1-acyl-sn-glycerol-3-phosphate acyltransferase
MSLYRFVRFFGLPFVRMFWPTKFINKENMDKCEGAVVICNHYSKLDGIIMAKIFKKELHVLIKKEAFAESKFSNWFLRKCGGIPISRGDADLSAIKGVLRVLKNNKKILIFPEGTRNKTGTDEIQEFKDGVSMFSLKTKTPIIPIILYKCPKICKKNYAYIGEPFELTEYYDRKDREVYTEATEKIFNEMKATQRKCYEYVAGLKGKKKK